MTPAEQAIQQLRIRLKKMVDQAVRTIGNAKLSDETMIRLQEAILVQDRKLPYYVIIYKKGSYPHIELIAVFRDTHTLQDETVVINTIKAS